MTDMKDIAGFIGLVMQMRRAQKKFFLARRYQDMQDSMALEKEVDGMAEKLLASVNGDLEAMEPRQGELFGGEE